MHALTVMVIRAMMAFIFGGQWAGKLQEGAWHSRPLWYPAYSKPGGLQVDPKKEPWPEC